MIAVPVSYVPFFFISVDGYHEKKNIKLTHHKAYLFGSLKAQLMSVISLLSFGTIV